MELFKLIIELIKALIWPVLIISIILTFRKQILSLFKDINELEYKGFKAKFTIPKLKAKKEEFYAEINKIEEEAKNSSEKKLLIKESIDELFKIFDFQNEARATTKEDNIKESTMLVFTTNDSKEGNLKYNIYYDPVERNHNSQFNYIGCMRIKKFMQLENLIK